MKKFRLSPEAAQDLTEIFEYLAQFSVDAAERVRTELYDAMRGLARMPGMGHRREDFTKKPVRFWPLRSYEIIYNPDSTPLGIVAVLHGKRNIKRILRKRL